MNDIYNEIKRDIDATIRKYMGCQLIINPRFNQEKHATFSKISSNKNTEFDTKISYVKNFFRCYDEGDYLFQLFDNSFIQVNYEFIVPTGQNQKVVNKANLSYYPNPGLYSYEAISAIQEIDDEEEREEYFAYHQEYKQDFQYASNYIRLDYDGHPSSFTEYVHPRCHIHIGLHNNFRLGVNKLPLLSDFIDFVLYVNYIEEWKKLHCEEEDDLNSFLTTLINTKKSLEMTEYPLLTENELKHYLLSL
ncbi:DUF2290 domain-containing protein [Planococcus plakortidis]